MNEFGLDPYTSTTIESTSPELKKGETLNRTKVTEEAQKKLESWGLTTVEIELLKGFTSQFRYDLCIEKITRISQNPVEINAHDGEEYINLPTFFDVNGRLDGQCGDIGKQWIIQINDSGILEYLNKGKTNLVTTVFYTGLSETHFCKPDSKHIWNGLVLVDENRCILDEIYIDASFQTIHTIEESKYTQKTAVYNVTEIDSIENFEMQVGSILFDGKQLVISIAGTAFIGISSDFEFAYAISFLKDQHTGDMRAVLKSFLKNGFDESYIFDNMGRIVSLNGTVTLSKRGDDIEQILRLAQQINFIEKTPTRNSFVWKKDNVPTN